MTASPTTRKPTQLVSVMALTVLLSACGRNTQNDGAWEKDYNLGSLELAQGHLAKAETLRQQALVDASGDRLHEVLSYGALAKVSRMEGKLPEAIAASKSGIEKALGSNDPDLINLATHLLVGLAKLYQQQGQAEEIKKLKSDYALPPLPPSPIADQQKPYLNALTEKAQKAWIANAKVSAKNAVGKEVTLLLILSPEAKERALLIVQSSGDADLDQASIDAVRSCMPYAAFPQRPEHSILGLLSFRTSLSSNQAPTAPPVTKRAGKQSPKAEVPDLKLPDDMSVPLNLKLPDEPDTHTPFAKATAQPK